MVYRADYNASGGCTPIAYLYAHDNMLQVMTNYFFIIRVNNDKLS